MALTVEDLYRQILGREPDPGGLAYWQQQFGQEVDPTEKSVFQQVAAPEIASRQAPEQPSAPTPTASTPRTISDVYRQFYGAVDPVGADFWRQQFGGENITPEQVARMVSDIGYNDPNANSGLTVEQVYRNYLGNTDQAGINYWKSQFGSGNLSNAQVAKLTEAQYGAVQRGGDGGFFGSVLGGLGSAISDIGGAIKGSGPIGAIAFTYFLPSLGAEIATKLGVDEIVGRAIAKATFNVAQGQDLDTAIKNSTIDAVTQTGSTAVAKDISDAVTKVGADAIASAGGSIVGTLAKGGSAQDAFKNAGASIAASLTSSEFGRPTGAAVGGAITGGAAGAAIGAAGELGKPSAPTGKQVASAEDVLKEPGVVSDVPTSDLGEVLITAPRDNVQVITPTATPKPVAKPTPPATTDVGEITVTAPREKPQDLGEITVTAPRDNVQDVTPDEKAEEPTDVFAEGKDSTKTSTDSGLFLYSGFPKYPYFQPTAQKPAKQAIPEVGSQALAQALRVGDPGEPLFGGKKKGPTSGWNIESLRYMGEES